MSKKIIDNSLPDIWATEDTLFWMCMNQIEEFPKYITKFDDIIGPINEKYLSKAYRNLKLDSVRIRKNGELTHAEHHSEVRSNSLSRNFEYSVTLHAATGRFVHPFIFNTGKIPKKTVEYASPTSAYSPIWFNTQEIEASQKLNNIKYKSLKQETLTAFEVIELIWMPKFRCNKPIDDIILEEIKLYQKIIIEERFSSLLREALMLWAGKYIDEEEKIKKVIEGLKMSAMEANELSAKIRSARIEGALIRSKEEGIKEGIKEGHKAGFAKAEETMIAKLLKTHAPQEISQELDIPLERILEIKNGN